MSRASNALCNLTIAICLATIVLIFIAIFTAPEKMMTIACEMHTAGREDRAACIEQNTTP